MTALISRDVYILIADELERLGNVMKDVNDRERLLNRAAALRRQAAEVLS